MATPVFSFDLGKALAGMTELQQKTMRAVEVYGRSAAQKMTAYAKTKGNAPWEDHSTNARNSMSAIEEWQGDKFAAGVQGGVEYAVYLEYCNGKKYAILHPTIHKFGPEIMSGLKGLL